MAGLVAYDGSGSSSEDDEPMPDSSAIPETSTLTRPVAPKASIMFSKFIDDEEDDIPVGGSDDEGQSSSLVDEENPMWSKFLPQPKRAPVVEEAIEEDVEIGPIPPKKTYGDEELPQPPKPSAIPSLDTSKVKGKVRISIPFLSSLGEDEAEDSNKRRFVEQSKKGSGLFALLPQPKNSFSESSTNIFLTKSKPPSASGTSSKTESSEAPQPMSSRSISRLIPDAVKNRLKRPAPEKLEEIRAKYSKKGLASAASTAVRKAKDSDDSDDEGGDFFSLDNAETIDPEALERLKLPTPNFERKPEITVPEKMEVEETYQAHPSSSSQAQQDDLMRYVQSKRGRKEDVKIIDINADDLRPENTEWLKNITDESAIPARRSKGLGGMVKRKHQITYLAFEAKAREQELKNQWAQNRAAKQATNNKYGF